MIYLSGAVNKTLVRRPDVGYMLTPMMGNKADLDGTLWAADTGCFNQPEKYDQEEYLRWLRARATYARRCLFATAPDVVGDAVATMAKSIPMFPLIQAEGFRAALVAQDGLEDLDIPWESFDCLFVGGTTEWKLSEIAYQLAHEADKRGKWVHQGRVNSWRRLKAAAVSGYDSADGTYLVFGPDINLPKLNGWLDALNKQPMMEFVS
tara:strand:+ start:249 stop:869 length:621 start_codon:yes stop_codon:yes gene_type:complete